MLLSDRLETFEPIGSQDRSRSSAGHRRLRFSFFADERGRLRGGAGRERAGTRVNLACALGPVAQVVRAHP
jgi:hypothetical protein